ncbi:MAG: VanW family protein [Eggerthellaceae bacterium]|nr:VanW family protein [Eggerthellaceae bacterium]MDR2716299.1 VanW family protein [Coriobacteriaceae bacterium]
MAVSSCLALGNPLLWTFDNTAGPNRTGTGGSLFPSLSLGGQDSGLRDTVMQPISEYRSISQNNDSDRARNLALAARAIDGVEIAPGQVFSFNEAVGDVENSSDYSVAIVIYGNEVAYARGGGISQVATALYNAALQGNMEIVERYPHTLITDYAPIGLDATVKYGEKDLKIKNTSEYPVYISVEATDKTVTVTLYGQPLKEGLSISATSVIVDQQDREGQQQDPNADAGAEALFFVVDSYRVFYQDGAKIDQEHLYTDIYEVTKDSAAMLGDDGYNPTN